MAKLAVQLRDKFLALVGRITSCGRARAGHNDAAGATEPNSAPSQHIEIRSRGGAPTVSGGSKTHTNDDCI
ncbi:uncharacterized protein LOC133894990 [Phragmites australis]|uniref:uncharacterized protein LOC133894990 n=1 Tax=Phragmites australis TaxID=29695 RepID=UPI002D796A77|nr:uncharacterized protein LOC133894990 [Phragmites australis]